MANLLPAKRLAATLSALAMVLAGCGAGSGSETTTAEGSQNPEALAVVVTTTIWGDIVSNITGDAAHLEVLFPIGADAHDYQLSSSQVAMMQEADLVVVNGLGLEEGIFDVIESLEADGANVLEIAAELDPLPFGAGERHDHEEGEMVCDPEAGHDHEVAGHAHAEGSCDPHIWMDPLRVATAVELIAEELAVLDSSVDWAANASAYADELRSLDDEIIGELEAVTEDQRKIVTNHEAFGYFAARYDFEVVGTVIPGGATLADPSSAALAELVETMTDEGIDVIFAETVEPAALAEAVAAEVGEDVQVVTLFTGSLGGPDSGAETYADMLRTNAELIAAALG